MWDKSRVCGGVAQMLPRWKLMAGFWLRRYDCRSVCGGVLHRCEFRTTAAGLDKTGYEQSKEEILRGVVWGLREDDYDRKRDVGRVEPSGPRFRFVWSA